MPMVYIKQIEPKIFLPFSPSKEGFALRDFSPPRGRVATVIKRQLPPEWTATRIRQLASAGTNRLIEVPGPTVDDYSYWHDQTVTLNAKFAIPEPPDPLEKNIVIVKSGGWKEHLVGIIATVIATLIATALLIWFKWK